MTKEQAVRWAHMQMRANRLMDKKGGIVQRCGATPGQVQMYKGAATLANALEVPFKIDMIDGDYMFPVRISFTFEGTEFFQLERDVENATDICYP